MRIHYTGYYGDKKAFICAQLSNWNFAELFDIACVACRRTVC
jgi:hypothetical protein